MGPTTNISILIPGPWKCYLIWEKDIHQCGRIKSSDEDIVPGHPGHHKQIATVLGCQGYFPYSAASV